MAETLGLITNRRYTKDGFRPGSSSRISGRLQARELGEDLDRAVVELLDVDRTAGLEQGAGDRQDPSRPCPRPLVIEPKKPLKTEAASRFRANPDAPDNPYYRAQSDPR